VIDHGIGINPDDQKKIFNPFFKTKDLLSRTHNPNSHGLGLSICQ
jgi:signal transduction histidine kinase